MITMLNFEPIKAMWLLGLPWLCEAIVVVQDHSGAAYVPLKDLCLLVCQRPTSPSHERRLLNHPQLASATCRFELLDGRSHWCLREEAAHAWLLTVLPRSLRPTLRPVVARLCAQEHHSRKQALILPTPIPNFSAGYAGTSLLALDQLLRQTARECFHSVPTTATS